VVNLKKAPCLNAYIYLKEIFHICVCPAVSHNGKVRLKDMDLHMCVFPAVSNTNVYIHICRFSKKNVSKSSEAIPGQLLDGSGQK
jgi:hypothetical protein